ncbi:MAG: hypothetical protein IT365_10800 [Candidatus Hydrogenedentes bacterium]|nr:hypothetical protein [Candidatus Hydrogenedentota bacterium]
MNSGKIQDIDEPLPDIVARYDLEAAFHFLTVVVSVVAIAIAYGIAHDLATAHLCVEYFTVGHPRIVDSESPVVLALVWGVAATWWIGAFLGVLLAIACRAGKAPKRTFRDVAPSIGRLLIVMAGSATAAGVTAFLLTKAGAITFPLYFVKLLPPETFAFFAADLWAHSASYATGAIGGLIVTVRVWRERKRDGMLRYNL